MKKYIQINYTFFPLESTFPLNKQNPAAWSLPKGAGWRGFRGSGERRATVSLTSENCSGKLSLSLLSL